MPMKDTTRVQSWCRNCGASVFFVNCYIKAAEDWTCNFSPLQPVGDPVYFWAITLISKHILRILITTEQIISIRQAFPLIKLDSELSRIKFLKLQTGAEHFRDLQAWGARPPWEKPSLFLNGTTFYSPWWSGRCAPFLVKHLTPSRLRGHLQINASLLLQACCVKCDGWPAVLLLGGETESQSCFSLI